MMKNVLLAIIICLTGCFADNSAFVINSAHKINVDFDILTKSKPRPNNDIFKTIRYIPLETRDDVLISGVDKILYSNSCFYILDSNSIFIFDKNGKFINCISKVGNGPREYLGINCFDLDKDGNVYIYDNHSSKIIKYGRDENDYEEIKMKNYFEEFAVVDRGLILRNVYNYKGIISHISYYDFQTEKIKELIGKDAYHDDFELARHSRFSIFRSNQHLHFHARFTGSIYRIDEPDTTTPLIKIHGPMPPEKDLVEFKDIRFTLDSRTSGYILDINNIYENSLFYSVNINKNFGYTLLISKKDSITANLLLGLGPLNKDYLGSYHSIFGVAEDEFISLLNPARELEANWMERVDRTSLSEEEKQTLLNLKQDDNPVLALLQFNDIQ